MTKPAAAAAQAQPSVRDVPMQLRDAQLQPATFDDKARTVEVTWTTGARVMRYDWFNDTSYEEELVVTPEAVDMSRFAAGAVPVLDSHARYGLDSVIGTVQRAWLDAGTGKAVLQLSERDELAGLVRDIKSGVIRSISVGYAVNRYEITRPMDRTDGGKLPLYRAVSWQPQEVSFVPIPADIGAASRSQPSQGGNQPCEFIVRGEAAPSAPAIATKESTMPTEAELQAQRDQEANAARIAAQAAVAAERQRSADITALCTRHGVAADKAAQYITDGTAVDAVRAAILDDLATRDAAAGNGARNVRVQTVVDETETRLRGIEEAITHRVDAKAKLTDNGQRFRGMSLLEIGRDHLEAAGVSTRGLPRLTLATQIMQHRSGGSMGTSDFANLLANVANKRLRQGYDENMPSYARWARRAPNAPDFKSMSVVQLGAAPDLLQTNEHGEFKYGAMTDGKETYSMLTYGRIVSFTRQSLVNDDLRGFDRLIGAFGNSAARLENRTVYAILTANAALADTGALFNATAVTTPGGHANQGTGAISVTSLGVGRAAMRVQKGLQSEELNIAPAYLICPAAIEQVAYQYTSANYVSATSANVNEFRAGGRTAVEPIVESILDATSATVWYLAANASSVDTVEYCYLDGAEGPVIESEMGFEVDGIAYKCRLDFAAKAIDFRGLWKSTGV